MEYFMEHAPVLLTTRPTPTRPESAADTARQPHRVGLDLAEIAPLLRCPVTHESLRPAPAEELARLNRRIAAGELRQRDGRTVTGGLSAALLDATDRYAYRVEDDVLHLLREEAIALVPDESPHAAEPLLRAESRVVQSFYDDFGWKSSAAAPDTFADASTFEDLRAVSEDYRHRCHLRVKDHLPPAGRYLLDVGSGPVQYPEYRTYSEFYDRRICVDLSRRALLEARRRLGVHGTYILGDVTHLPLQDDAVDGLVCLHTLYHVPRDRQADALRELYRVIRPGGSGVVVYSWGEHALLTNLLLLRFPWLRPLRRQVAWRLAQLARRLAKSQSGAPCAAAAPRLYFHAHPYGWWKQQDRGFDFDVRVWRSASVAVLRRYVPSGPLGRLLLRGLFAVEELFPRATARIAQHPMFILKK